MAELPFTCLPVPPGPVGVATVTRAAAALIRDSGPAFAPTPEAGPGLPPGEVPADLGMVVTTSGTTGAPLHVMIRREAALTAARSGAHALGPPGHWLTPIPVTSIGGVMTVLRALLAGAEPIPWPGVGGAAPFTGDAFVTAGSEVLRRAASDGVPAYVSLVPTQLTRIVRLPAAMETLAGFAGVLVGGAALSAGVRAAAEKAGARVVETYGATETCGGVVYDGVPLPDVEILLQEHPDLPEATVTVGGPTIASGYLGRPDLSAAVFAEGRFASSDLGRWRDGRLQLLGRSDGVVKIAGSKVPLAGVADVLRQDSRVLDATVTAHPDLEWDHHLNAYVVPVDEALVGTPQGEALAESLADRVTEAFGGATRPRSMAIVAELPVTASGKPVVAVSRIH